MQPSSAAVTPTRRPGPPRGSRSPSTQIAPFAIQGVVTGPSRTRPTATSSQVSGPAPVEGEPGEPDPLLGVLLAPVVADHPGPAGDVDLLAVDLDDAVEAGWRAPGRAAWSAAAGRSTSSCAPGGGAAGWSSVCRRVHEAAHSVVRTLPATVVGPNTFASIRIHASAARGRLTTVDPDRARTGGVPVEPGEPQLAGRAGRPGGPSTVYRIQTPRGRSGSTARR